MKKKLLLILSLLILVAGGIFLLKAMFSSYGEELSIPESGLTFELPEKTFRLIESSGEPIRISLGQVSHSRAVVDILLGTNQLKKEDVKIGETIQFNYEGAVYSLRLKDIKAKIIGEEKAILTLTKKGKGKNVIVEKSVSEIIDNISTSEFEVFRKKSKIPKRRFLRRLKNKSRKTVTFDELKEIVEEHFPKYDIKENGQYYNSLSEWLETKK